MGSHIGLPVQPYFLRLTGKNKNVSNKEASIFLTAQWVVLSNSSTSSRERPVTFAIVSMGIPF